MNEQQNLPPVPVSTIVNYGKLLSVLIKKRPEVKSCLETPHSKAHKFITRQLHWMEKGFKEEIAFQKTEEEMAKNLAEARSHSAMLYEIGASTNVKSFMDYHQQVAEYEGRLKVKQIVRDLPKYLRSIKDFEVFKERNTKMDDWEKMTVNFVRNDESLAPDKSFISKVKDLNEYANEKANKADGIQGLSDSMILWTARDAYRHLKKTSKGLIDELTSLGVKVGADNNIDVSMVKNKDLREALLKNPMISSVLNQDFEEKYATQELIPEVQEPPSIGPTEGKEVVWESENPYKQIYGRLKPDEIETQEERIERLKRIWHEGQQKTDENTQFKLQQEAVVALRSVRMKIDQIMVSEGKDPVFPKHKEYSKEELLLTHKLDIERMSRFLAIDRTKLKTTKIEDVELVEIDKLIDQISMVEDTEPVGYDKDLSSKGKVLVENADSSESETEGGGYEIDTEEEEAMEIQYHQDNLSDKYYDD